MKEEQRLINQYYAEIERVVEATEAKIKQARELLAKGTAVLEQWSQQLDELSDLAKNYKLMQAILEKLP